MHFVAAPPTNENSTHLMSISPIAHDHRLDIMENTTTAGAGAGATAGCHHRSLHFVLIPWLAQGHMIPMIDIARLLASRPNVSVTIVTTPVNAARIRPTIARISASPLPIRFLPLPFPAAEHGLPDGCENLDSLPSRSLAPNFVSAVKKLSIPLLPYLRDHPPHCLVSDFGHPWTDAVAKELGVPRFVFHGYNCFSILASHNLNVHRTHESVLSETGTLVLPGMPHRIEMTRPKLPRQFHANSPFKELYREVREGELSADGVVINSFEELEPGYREALEEAMGKKAWMIGPVSLAEKSAVDVAERGNRAAVDESRCMEWLESKKRGSVVYVSFGSMGSFPPKQLVELGEGLLDAGRPFVWVIKAAPASVEEWLSDRFGDEERCLLIRGWAPQVMILSHPAVGGFVTHCGWNSTIEGIGAGLPMVTWPLFAEQFLNEKVLVEVLGIGVSVGARRPTEWAGGEKEDVADVGREAVAAAVGSLIEEGEEADGRRRRAAEMAVKARRALEEGGSSRVCMDMLIEFVLTNHCRD